MVIPLDVCNVYGDLACVSELDINAMKSTIRFGLTVAVATVAIGNISSAASAKTCIQSDKVKLDNPHAVRLAAGNQKLFVADTDNDRIVVLDPVKLTLKTAFGGRQLDGVRDIDVDSHGRLYAVATHNNKVVIYDVQTTPPRLVGRLQGGISRPESVLVHPNGSIYVSGAWTRNVVAFRGGKKIAMVDGLSAPRALALGRDGRIWIADSSKNQITLATPMLKLERVIKGEQVGFNDPHDVEVAEDGRMIIVEKSRHQIKLISQDGRLLDSIGTGRAGKDLRSLRRPSGATMSGNVLWIADSGNNRVLRCMLDISRS